MKKRKQLIIGIVVVILLIVIIITLCNKTELYIREDKINNKEIEHIALVYRFENYAWGHQEYIYIIDENGSVFYEDFVSNDEEYIDYEDDLLSVILHIYDNEDKLECKFEKFDDTFKEKLYKFNYNWNFYKKEYCFDAGISDYYCLLSIDSEHKLVKLQQLGDSTYLSLRPAYDEICDYIDDVRRKIYEYETK